MRLCVVAHSGWAYNLLLDEFASSTATYFLLADLGLFEYKLASSGSAAGLGHGPARGWQVDALATTFAFPKDRWAVMCANGVIGTDGWFHDTHSLRTAELPDTPSLHRRGVTLSAHLTPLHEYNGAASKGGYLAPVAVDACFGGMTVFQRHALIVAGSPAAACRFEPATQSWHDAHFGFHACVREVAAVKAAVQGLGVPPATWVNPAMMVHYDTESAGEFCDAVPCSAPPPAIDPTGHRVIQNPQCAFSLQNEALAALPVPPSLRSGWHVAAGKKGLLKDLALVSATEEDCVSMATTRCST